MTDERRYGDEEVQEILDLAARDEHPGRHAVTGKHGLSLAELQDIAREVGIDPDRIARAAAALDVNRNLPAERSYFGVPLSVARTVELPRAPTDREWEVLVGELRRTFDARGRVTSQGNLREWTNGNLHVYVEPTETGHRLRLRTLKGSALARTMIGGTLLSLGAVIGVVLFLTGQLAEDVALPLMLGLLGLGALASNVITLPPWARERARQMEQVGARAQELLAGEPPEPGDTA